MVEPGVTVLIVEDSGPTRKMLRTRFEALGCRVVGEAENAFDGVRFFRELAPAIVSLDLVMPQVNGVSGEELFNIIRVERSDVSVIVISSSPKAATASSYLARGAIAYLEKPFVNFDQLRDELEFLYPQLRRHGLSHT